MTTAAPLVPAVEEISSGGGLTTLQGAALTLAAVLGTGVISLPALAADTAGPASLFAWVLLGQLPALIQLGGGALIVAGVVLVRTDEARGARTAGARAARAEGEPPVRARRVRCAGGHPAA